VNSVKGRPQLGYRDGRHREVVQPRHKGFGFIAPSAGGKDVFIHATALERAGLLPLQEGQSVRMSVVQGVKGLEVGSISLD